MQLNISLGMGVGSWVLEQSHSLVLTSKAKLFVYLSVCFKSICYSCHEILHKKFIN